MLLIGYFKICDMLTQRRRSICSSSRHQTSSCRHFGLQIVQTSTRSITRYGGLLQQRVYSRKIQNVDELRQRIVEEWERLDQRVIDNAVKQWRRRLSSCVAAKGGHFEQMLYCANLTVSLQLHGIFKVYFCQNNVIRFLSLSVTLRNKFELLTSPR